MGVNPMASTDIHELIRKGNEGTVTIMNSIY